MTPEVGGWFAAWWPIWAPFLLLLVGSSGAGIWVIWNRRDGEKVARRNPLPPTWPEMWARIDAQGARIDALEDELGDARKQAREMTHHIVLLERMIPDPPGPPVRPDWTFPILKGLSS